MKHPEWDLTQLSNILADGNGSSIPIYIRVFLLQMIEGHGAFWKWPKKKKKKKSTAADMLEISITPQYNPEISAMDCAWSNQNPDQNPAQLWPHPNPENATVQMLNKTITASSNQTNQG